jgi:hypothetical protein
LLTGGTTGFSAPSGGYVAANPANTSGGDNFTTSSTTGITGTGNPSGGVPTGTTNTGNPPGLVANYIIKT